MRRYLLRGISRIASEQFPDRSKRQVELTKHRHELRAFKLRVVVVPVARASVDPRGDQHTEFIVESKCLYRKARPTRELTDADFFHPVHSLVIAPNSTA